MTPPLVVDALDEVALKGAVLSIGNFDGVHLGHRALLGRMRSLADELGRGCLVVTFFPPAKVLFGRSTYLSSAEEKLALLTAFSPEVVAMIPFTEAYARTDKASFLDVLRRLAPHTIVVGEDFRFGHKRSGTLNDLSQLPERLEVFGLQTVDGEVVKSTRIREYLLDGRIDDANRLLGSSYLVMGTVIEGQRRGRTIGYPTANLAVDEKKALPLGVFAVRVETEQGTCSGMANVGRRPSFPEEAPAVEVHLFDVDADLYGQRLTVRFEYLLRKQRTFADLEALRTQLGRDEQAAREALARPATGRGERRNDEPE